MVGDPERGEKREKKLGVHDYSTTMLVVQKGYGEGVEKKGGESRSSPF